MTKMHHQANKIHPVALSPAPGLELFHTGPPLDFGPLPSFFYFALSGPDSLSLDPFNQPVQFLQGQMIRIFSMTLPAHEGNLDPKNALAIWAEDYAKGLDPIGDFLDQAEIAIAFAIKEKFAHPEKLAVGGLSRGGLIAAHVAARDERFKHLIGFAPLTQLNIKEFIPLQHLPAVSQFDLKNIANQICNRKIRLYISNADTRVNTKTCFNFAMQLVEEAEKQSIRSPQVELFIYPPIGHMGHGTPPYIFREGANWIHQCLK